MIVLKDDTGQMWSPKLSSVSGTTHINCHMAELKKSKCTLLRPIWKTLVLEHPAEGGDHESSSFSKINVSLYLKSFENECLEAL